MKHILKLIYRSLPTSLKLFLRPVIFDIVKFISTIFGLSLLNSPIGKAAVPYYAKSLLRKSFAQQGEDLILDRVLTRVLKKDVFEPYTYVDVGGYDAIDTSVTYLLYLRGWRGIVFDPSKSSLKSFKKFRKRDYFVNAVVGDEDGVDVEFYIPKRALQDKSSTNTKYPNTKSLEEFNKVIFRQVNLNEELRRQGIKKIDFLNIDVEGAELEILKSLDFEFFKPSVIAVEIHGNNLEECLKTDEVRLILERGYQFVGSAVITQFFVRKDEIPPQ